MKWSPGDRGNIEDRRGVEECGPGMPLGIGGVLRAARAELVHRHRFSLAAWRRATQQVDSSPAAPPAQSTPQEERRGGLRRRRAARHAGRPGQRSRARATSRPSVVLFRDAIQSACGAAESATGPFYCPSDHKVYLDLGFFDELTRAFRRTGRFCAGVRRSPTSSATTCRLCSGRTRASRAIGGPARKTLETLTSARGETFP